MRKKSKQISCCNIYVGKHMIWVCGQTSWPLSPPPLYSLHLSIHSSLPPLISFLTPSLCSYLPAAAQGVLALTVPPQTKEWIELQKKNEWQLWTPLFPAPLCLPPLPCSSLVLPLLCFIPGGVSMVSGVPVLSNGHSDCLVCTTWTTMARSLTRGQAQGQQGLHLQSRFHYRTKQSTRVYSSGPLQLPTAFFWLCYLLLLCNSCMASDGLMEDLSEASVCVNEKCI